MRTLPTLISLLLVAGLLAVMPAAACTHSPPQPDIWIDILGTCTFSDPAGTTLVFASITFHDYTTFGSNGGTFCACGLSKVGGIRGVLGAKIVDVATQQVLVDFPFQLDRGASKHAASLLVGEDVQGFLATIANSVPADIPVNLVFDVVLANGTSASDVEQALLSQGGATVVTAEADAWGNFVGHVGALP